MNCFSCRSLAGRYCSWALPAIDGGGAENARGDCFPCRRTQSNGSGVGSGSAPAPRAWWHLPAGIWGFNWAKSRVSVFIFSEPGVRVPSSFLWWDCFSRRLVGPALSKWAGRNLLVACFGGLRLFYRERICAVVCPVWFTVAFALIFCDAGDLLFSGCLFFVAVCNSGRV